MSDTELLIEEIKTLPPSRVAEVLDFVESLKRREECSTEGELRFNAETIAAFEEGDAMISGEIPTKWYSSLEEMLADLNKDD